MAGSKENIIGHGASNPGPLHHEITMPNTKALSRSLSVNNFYFILITSITLPKILKTKIEIEGH